MFEDLDLTKSGYITKEEICQGVTRLGNQLPQAQVEALFSRVDADLDGQISFQEFRRFLLLAPAVDDLSDMFEYWERTRYHRLNAVITSIGFVTVCARHQIHTLLEHQMCGCAALLIWARI